MEITPVLFDIDGTLLDLKGAGRKAFVTSVNEVFRLNDDLSYIQFAGNTDLNVLQQVMNHHGRELTPEDCRRFFRFLPEELERAARNAELILYPGVRPLLEALSARHDMILGLVTGNIAACARIKLRQFNLHHHFVLGAFGDDHADRKEIARLALERVRRKISGTGTLGPLFLIGDTPNDIAAAKSIGAVAVAVATGKFNTDDLRAAEADVVLPDLGDTACVMEILAGPQARR